MIAFRVDGRFSSRTPIRVRISVRVRVSVRASDSLPGLCHFPGPGPIVFSQT